MEKARLSGVASLLLRGRVGVVHVAAAVDQSVSFFFSFSPCPSPYGSISLVISLAFFLVLSLARSPALRPPLRVGLAQDGVRCPYIALHCIDAIPEGTRHRAAHRCYTRRGLLLNKVADCDFSFHAVFVYVTSHSSRSIGYALISKKLYGLHILLLLFSRICRMF